ncbi:MAG: DNA gyrase subunit A, partial [Solobacterium sp.]|nr:DNA gyrase subunit A [Solobacterium sp.]
MSQDWKVRLPLIDMHGNNGSIDDDPAAAMRYTEARLAKVTQVMEEDLDKNTVEMAPNFDDTEHEPTVLPVPFPVMLVNGATGIAAGYATNMPPHNLNEVVDATIYRIQNPESALTDVMDILTGPDFPTGGIVQGEAGIRDAFTTGKGRIVVRSKCEIHEEKSCQQIIITEIPYEVVKGQLVKKMDEIRVSKDIDGILDVRDESDREGLRIVVDVRKDIDANMILNYFYKNTDLQVYYNYNNVAIIDKRPVQVGLLGLLDAFIAFRKEVVLRRSRYELDKMEARCHIIEGLMKAVSILDEVIRIIRASQDKGDAKRNLMNEFGFDEPQSEAIVSLRLYRLSNTDIITLREEFAELVNQIEETKAIIENENVLHSVIIKELRNVKKEYGQERRTRIEAEVEEINYDKTAMIANERVVVTVSRDGYLKRVSMRSYNA